MSHAFTSKLVRNRIPAMMKGQGTHEVIFCDELTGDQLLNKLCEKLYEEVGELIEVLKNNSLSKKVYAEKLVEEIADVVQVLMNITTLKLCNWSLVVHTVAKKRNQKGDFSRGYVITYRKKETKEATLTK